MKRVLLVNPHDTAQNGYSNPPLGLLYITGTLKKNGVSVQIVDGCLDGIDAIQKALVEFQPHIVGITCLTPAREKALEVARMVCEFDPGALTILGGAHPTIMYRQLLDHFACVDVVVCGEGEQSFLEIVQERPYETIPGIAFRQDGQIVKTAERPNVARLDDIPFPAWDMIDFSRYKPWGRGTYNGVNLAKVPRVSVVFSRGCTGHCDFCSTWWIWKGYRHRSPVNMADEIEWLYRDFGIRHFCFADDAFSVDRDATAGLCHEIIRRRLRIAFFATTRTDCVDAELLSLMKQAGCYEVSYGIETASQQLLDGMNKENEIDNAYAAIRMTKEAGIRATALMIVGNIGETDETVRETLQFLKSAKPDVVGSTGGLWILPGTKVFQQCKMRGFIDDDFWLSDEPYKVYTLEHSAEKLAVMSETLYSYSLKGRIRRFLKWAITRIHSLSGK